MTDMILHDKVWVKLLTVHTSITVLSVYSACNCDRVNIHHFMNTFFAQYNLALPSPTPTPSLLT